MKRELTTEEKWRPVDHIINRVEQNRAEGRNPYEFGLDEYIDLTFNRKNDEDA